MSRPSVLDPMAQKAVCLIANADAGFTQEDLGQIFHVSRDVIQRTLSRNNDVATKNRTGASNESS